MGAAIASLANEATEKRFEGRLATAVEQNLYRVGWGEGYEALAQQLLADIVPTVLGGFLVSEALICRIADAVGVDAPDAADRMIAEGVDYGVTAPTDPADRVRIAQLVGGAIDAQLTSLDGVLGLNWIDRDHVELEVEEGDTVRWFRLSVEEMA